MGDAGPVLNLIELCEEDPELANAVVSGGHARLPKGRIAGVPWVTYASQPISARQINRMVSARGSVIRTYEVLFKNVTSEQVCLLCNASSLVCEQDTRRRAPPACGACGSTSLRLTRDFQGAVSSQSIRIQDIGSSRSMSETLEVLLEGPAAGKFVPGDKLFVTGIVTRRWKQLRPNEPMLSSLVLRAIAVEKEDENEGAEARLLLDGYMRSTAAERRRFLMRSFAPSLVGVSACKLGMLLALVSGGAAGACDAGGTRASIHVLLVGDPGTGKSHMLKAASKLVSPAVFTNGVGTSDAGLTSCAVRQGREWSLEGGALVLADTGLCCIDEFHRLSAGEKSGLLEAMEQQTISVAKAGIVATLHTRCSVLAAASTRSAYNPRRTVSENLGLSSPLVSRFDLIFGLFDVRSGAADAAKSACVLARGAAADEQEPPCWPPSALRAFVAQCRRRSSRMSDALSGTVLRYYTRKRSVDGHSEFNTIRMLEGLVRLSEAHARLMCREAVEEEDVYVAVVLMELAISTSSTVDIDAERVFVDDAYFADTRARLDRTYMLR